MRSKRSVVHFTLALAFLVIPASAVEPPSTEDLLSSFDAIFAPAVSAVPEAPVPAATPTPYSGYCSQTCSPCYYPGHGTPSSYCPVDPDTGFRQVCARQRIC